MSASSQIDRLLEELLALPSPEERPVFLARPEVAAQSDNLSQRLAALVDQLGRSDPPRALQVA
jgi:hypothetical protein